MSEPQSAQAEEQAAPAAVSAMAPPSEAPSPGPAPIKLEDEQPHTPAIPSPLNPEMAKQKRPVPAREQREKKDSLKKREAKGEETVRSGTPDKQVQSRGSKKAADAPKQKHLELQRYRIPPPKALDYQPAGFPSSIPSSDLGQTKFVAIPERVHNKRGYRYIHAIADPQFPHSKFNRQTDAPPCETRFDYEDSSGQIHFSEDVKAVTTEKGWRMARANVALREGRWYWELKVLSGIRYASNPTAKSEEGTHYGGHFRAGISRREASLEHPVGFDAYSYGIRDVHGEKFHMSSPDKFFSSGESMVFGDVIGFELNLPSLGLHKKVVQGDYNKAVDGVDDQDASGLDSLDPHSLIRDRFPVRYKNELYFELLDYQPSKELEDLFLPPTHTTAPSAAAAKPPNPNHPQVSLRTLPGSYLKVYRNGKLMGTAFENLLGFLPPASKPSGSTSREGLDDGSLGYYPTVSVFSGGAVEANFGPSFAYPPPEVAGEDDVDMIGEAAVSNFTSGKRIRPVCDRYNEQIAEDVVLDIIDEVDSWAQDGGVIRNDDNLPVANSSTVPEALGGNEIPGSVPMDETRPYAPFAGPGEVKTLEVNED